MWIGVGIFLFAQHRPEVLDITRDPGGIDVIRTADGFDPDGGENLPTFMALWGRDYWALAYAQEYQEKLEGMELVDHNADLDAIFAEKEKLYMLSSTFYVRLLEQWIERFGSVHLSLAAPGVVEIAKESGVLAGDPEAAIDFDLGNGITVREAHLDWQSPKELWLIVSWENGNQVQEDYSVAVHLVAADPPIGPQDILSQADQAHPVEGWYPVSRWQNGEIIRDMYRLEIPEGASAIAVRLSMYQVGGDGQFTNTNWLSLAIPP